MIELTSQALVLGGGLGVTSQGDTILTPNSQARAERAIELYKSNPAAFNRAGAVIVCTGGATRLSDSDAYSKTEAMLLADTLMAADIPAQLIETEEESNNTLTNFYNSAEILDVKTKELNGESILGVVTQAWHYHPRAKYLGEMILNIPMTNFGAPGKANLQRKIQEIGLTTVYHGILAGIKPGDRETVYNRVQMTGHIARLIKAPLSKVWQ